MDLKYILNPEVPEERDKLGKDGTLDTSETQRPKDHDRPTSQLESRNDGPADDGELENLFMELTIGN